MSTSISLSKRGICDLCEVRPIVHGPWTDDQIKEACDDLGSDPADFSDWCDDCFVQHVAGGDTAWARHLSGGRELQLVKP